MKPDLNCVVIVTDATNGDHIASFDIDKWSTATIESMIVDIFNHDCYKLQHGILIKYGIRPNKV